MGIGAVEKGLTVDTEVGVRLGADTSGFTNGLNGASKRLGEFEHQVRQTQSTFNKVGFFIGLATAATINYARQSVMAAAAVSEMDRTISAVATATGKAESGIVDTARAVEAMGIEMDSARKTAVKFAQNNLQMADAAKLARAAQDLAVVSQSNSTETLNRLIHGVMTQNSLVLKNAGIVGQAGDMMRKYAESLGMTVAQLSPAQRQQAIVNGVMEEALKVQGAYEESMNEVGKVLRSFPRVLQNVKVSFGDTLLQGISPVVLGTYKMVDAFQKALRVYPQNVKGTSDYTMETGGLVHVMEALTQIMTAVLTPIGEFAQMLARGIASIRVTREEVEALFGRLSNALPVLSGFAVAASAIGANSLIATFGLGRFLGSINPVVTGLLTFVLMSTEVRDSLITLFQTVRPIIDAFAGLALSVSGLVVEFAGYLVPAVVTLVDALTQMLAPLAKFLGESERGRTVFVGLVAALVAIRVAGLTTFTSFATRGVLAVRTLATRIMALTVGTTQASAAMHRLGAAQRLAAVGSNIKAAAVRRLTFAFRSLMAATGIGLVIVGLTLLVEAMMKAWQANGKFVDAVVNGGNILIGAFEKIINAGIRFLNLFLPKSAQLATVTLSRINRELIGVGKNLEDLGDDVASDVDWGHLDSYIATAEAAGEATDYLGQAMDKFRQQMERLNGVVYDFGRFVNDITDFRDPMSKAMDEVAYQTAKFDAAMQDATKTSDELTSGFSDMAAKIRSELGSALQYARSQLDAAQREFDAFNKAIYDSITGVMDLGRAMLGRDGLEQSFAALKQSAAGAVMSMLDFRQLVSVSPSSAYVGFVRALGEALDAMGSDSDDTFLGRLRQRRDQMVEFGETMRALADMGLSEAGVRQVMGAGYEAGLAIGRQLIEGGVEAVSEVNQILEGMFSLADDVGESVAAGFYDLGGGMGDALVAGLTEQAEKAAAFAERIRQLVELGLSPTAIRQVLAAGVDAGMRIADALIDGGVTIVDEVNRLYDATATIAEATGKFGASKFFAAGVKAAKALMDAIIRQIQAEIPRLDHLLLQVAERLEALARQNAAEARALAGAGVTDIAGGTIAYADIDAEMLRRAQENVKAAQEARAAADRLRSSVDRRTEFARRFGEQGRLDRSAVGAARREDFARTQGTQSRLAEQALGDRKPVTSVTSGGRTVVIENQYNTFNESLDFQTLEQRMGFMFGTQQAFR